ncbi:MAG: hypothetical protein Q8P86_02115 [bacterium]|nr:hypothetical protein [bacterium]
MKEQKFRELIEEYIDKSTGTPGRCEREARGILHEILDARVPFKAVYRAFQTTIEQLYEMELQNGLENEEVSWVETVHAVLVFKLWATGPQSDEDVRKFVSVFNRYESKVTLILGEWGIHARCAYAVDEKGSEEGLFFVVSMIMSRKTQKRMKMKTLTNERGVYRGVCNSNSHTLILDGRPK